MRKLKTIELRRLSVDDFKKAEKLPVVVVVDDIRSMYNIGSIFRTSDAFRVENIYICGISGTPPSTEIHKTAIGAEDSVDWKYYKSVIEAVRSLKESGYKVFSVEQAEGSTLLNEFSPTPSCKYALVFGNEVKGVKQEVIDLSDGCLEIPQFGTKHSINVSVAAGIVIHYMAMALMKK